MKRLIVFCLLVILSITIYFHLDVINLMIKGYDFDYAFNLINHKDFKEENLDRYLKLKLEADESIFIVNNNYDLVEHTNFSLLLDFYNQDYFIEDNIERYLDYYNDTYTFEEVVSHVNSNIDNEYYTNITNTNTSDGYLMLVNKYTSLASDFRPNNLVSIDDKYGIGSMDKNAYEQYIKMYNDLVDESYKIKIVSSYRSYSYQNTLYNNYVDRDGQIAADTYSAKAGHSEHQTGLAIDITDVSGTLTSFENSPTFEYIKNNAHKYGFILRYPEDSTLITGYSYEPWHYRYVGVDVATEIYNLNITFDEYYAYFVNNN